MSSPLYKVLFIGHLWPEPASSAAGYRTLSLLNSFINYPQQKNWDIYFASAAEPSKYCADLDALSITTHSIKLNDSSFDKLLGSMQPDIVVYDRFITEEQFASRVAQQCPEAMNVLDTQDLHFLRRARQKALKARKHLNQPPAADTELVDAPAADLQTEDAIREIGAILRCDLSLIISNYEMQLLLKQFKLDARLIHYCPFMFANKRNQLTPDFQQREHFVMIGNFLHAPNWDAVCWCKQNIWPRIRKQLPDAELHVYGAYATEKARKLHQPEMGFLLKGRAQNALHTLQAYRVNLAPLRFGAGLKGKIVDGFMSRTPCVTTKIGAEGMLDALPWGGLIAGDEQSLADKAVELYQNQSLWEQCSTRAKQIIRQQFDEKHHANEFVNKVINLREQLAAHRNTHFLGKLLRHELYRSSYFMSKWIEEKNSSTAK